MSALETINFTRGVPANESFPVADLVQCATAALNSNADVLLQYGPAAGLASLRTWLAEWQGVKPEQVLTGNGSLELVEFLCTAMIKPGDVVFTESPSYDRAITLFRRHGANVIGVPLQADGPDLAALEKLLAEHKPKLFYVIPDFQNPSGATCSGAKRKALVALAEKHDLLLLEDAPYRMLRYRGTQEPTLFSLAPHRVLHMTSFTKLIAPGRAPGLHDRRRCEAGEDRQGGRRHLHLAGLLRAWRDRRMAEGGQAAAADREAQGALRTAPRGLPRRARQAHSRCGGHASGWGFFLSLTLPAGVSTTDLRTAATKQNLNLADGLAFFPNGGGERFLRLPFCALTPAQIDEGIRRLAVAMKEVRK